MIMKTKYLSLIAGFAIVVMLLAACKKDYYQDTGLAKGKFNGSVLAYLQSKPEYFSKLLQVIAITKTEDIFQKENITFFAPSNPCFDSTIAQVNRVLYFSGKDTIVKLTQVPVQVWREMLARYIFKGKYMLNDIPQIDFSQYKTYPGVFTRSYDGTAMNLGVVYNNEGGAQYVGYRQLHISYTPDISQLPGMWFKAPVASVNIEPDNGAVHVLVFSQHNFGFSIDEFYNRCMQYGISGK
jgi:hypothetical protein